MKPAIVAFAMGLVGAGVAAAQQWNSPTNIPPQAPLPSALPSAAGQYAPQTMPSPTMPSLPAAQASPNSWVPWTPLSAMPMPAFPQNQQAPGLPPLPSVPLPPPPIPDSVPPLPAKASAPRTGRNKQATQTQSSAPAGARISQPPAAETETIDVQPYSTANPQYVQTPGMQPNGVADPQDAQAPGGQPDAGANPQYVQTPGLPPYSSANPQYVQTPPEPQYPNGPQSVQTLPAPQYLNANPQYFQAPAAQPNPQYLQAPAAPQYMPAPAAPQYPSANPQFYQAPAAPQYSSAIPQYVQPEPPSRDAGPHYYQPPPAQPSVNAVPQPAAPIDVPIAEQPSEYQGAPLGIFDSACWPKKSFWVNADYLMWWIKPGPNPDPLVTTSTSQQRLAGDINQPGTVVLFGGQNLNFDYSPGVRVSAGMWSSDQRWGFEISGFVMQQNSISSTFSGGANGQPFLGIPFVDAVNGKENVYFVSQNFANPSLSAMLTGSVNVAATSQMWGWESNGLMNVYRSRFVNASMLLGFRALNLTESLQVNESLRNISNGGALTFAGAPVDPSQSVGTFDKFSTQNNFYGPQIGTRLHFEYNRFSLDLTGKAAFGVSQEVLSIAGSSTLLDSSGNPISTLPGGVFAQNTNIGERFENRFAVVPEGSANLNYAVTSWMTLRAGYNFIYWSNVLRPGNQIDRTINPGLVPTDITYGSATNAIHPAVTSQTSTVWMQGVNFGLELRY